MSAYRAAIEQTIGAIDQRSRTYRNQVVVVVAIASGSAAGALVLHELWPLTGFLAIVPACGWFLWLDSRRVTDWRSTMLQQWARRDIDLMAYAQAMRANPLLPEITLNGMLGLLGTAEFGSMELRASAPTRCAVAVVAGFADSLRLREFAIKVVAAALVAAGACGAVAASSWMPLGLAGVPVLAPLYLRWFRAARRRRSRTAVQAARQHADFDADVFRRMVEHLQPGIGTDSTAGWLDAEPANRRSHQAQGT